MGPVGLPVLVRRPVAWDHSFRKYTCEDFSNRHTFGGPGDIWALLIDHGHPPAGCESSFTTPTLAGFSKS